MGIGDGIRMDPPGQILYIGITLPSPTFDESVEW